MTLTADQELWAVALWVEKHHGDEGDFYIAQQIDRLLEEGDFDGIGRWRQAGERFQSLKQGYIEPS